jgi:hypothetical protein
MLKLVTRPAVFFAVALSWLAAPCATAAVLTLDFESVAPNAGNGPAYLNSYGITLSGVSPAGPSGVVDIRNNGSIYSPGSLWINDNFLMSDGGGAPPVSYTLNFSTPLQSISFERIATPVNLSTEPQWSATAFAGITPVGTAGETLDSWGNGAPAHLFMLSGSGITSLTVSANGFGFTGIGGVPLDNFVLTQVPEPSSITIACFGLISLGLVAAGKKIRRG